MIKLFTHNDLDGWGNIFILEQLFPKKECDCEICNYDNINEKIIDFIIKFKNGYNQEYNYVFIADIGINEEVAKRIDEINKDKDYIIEILLFDHHKTSEYLNKYDWVTFDINKCGTKIFFESNFIQKYINNYLYLSNEKINKIEKVVNIIDNYDLWKWVDKNNPYHNSSYELNLLFWHLGTEELSFLFNLLFQSKSNEDDSLIRKVNTVIHTLKVEQQNYIKKKIEKIKNNLNVKTDKNDYKFIQINAEQHISELGNEILKEFNEIDYVEIYNYDIVNKKIKISLRSMKENVDVSKIAKIYNGGGHKHSSGYEIKMEGSYLI